MNRRPIIGIAYCDSSKRDNEMRIRTYVSRKYYRAIYASGGLPILLPAIDPYFNSNIGDNKKEFPESYDHILSKFLGMVDGLLFPGGEDVHPRYQNEDPDKKLDLVNPFRDEFELAMAIAAYKGTFTKKRIPTLGICRGAQVLAIALGGTVHQDIAEISKIQHSQQAPRWETFHKISVIADSRLKKILSTKSLFVNSFHHQSINKLPDGFYVSARTSDDIIEAIEPVDHSYFIGVQWHPEETFDTDKYSRNLFVSLVEAAKA
jgi:putative glutamine amidotransferase